MRFMVSLVQKTNPECSPLSNLNFGAQRHKIKRSDGVHNQFGLSDNIGSMRFYVNEEGLTLA